MPTERTFERGGRSKDKPVGFSFTPKADKSVNYSGAAVDVKM